MLRLVFVVMNEVMAITAKPDQVRRGIVYPVSVFVMRRHNPHVFALAPFTHRDNLSLKQDITISSCSTFPVRMSLSDIDRISPKSLT